MKLIVVVTLLWTEGNDLRVVIFLGGGVPLGQLSPQKMARLRERLGGILRRKLCLLLVFGKFLVKGICVLIMMHVRN